MYSHNPKSISASWGAGLCHPLPLIAVLVTAINDHWLKGSGVIAASVTGKLSDVAGLFFFPMLLVALWFGGERLLGKRSCLDRGVPALACCVTALVFTMVNLSSSINDISAAMGMVKVMDPSDLWALPVLLLSWRWLERVYA